MWVMWPYCGHFQLHNRSQVLDHIKVETPIHDNNLILTPIIAHKVVDNELEVARNFTWAVLGMEDGNF
jgi:hypothetical protein